MAGKTIVVRRSVLAAVQELEEISDSKPLDVAERKIIGCRTREDKAGMKFWRSVWIHLMLTKYAPGEIVILQDDDEYHPNKEPVSHEAPRMR